MKRIIIILITAMMLMVVKGQDSDIQTIFGGDTRISGMGGPIMSFSSMNGEFALMMGGGGGVLLDDFFIGGYGEGLTNQIIVGGNKTEFGHGGFWAGYSYMGNKSFHPAISSQVGWGTLTQMNDFTVVSTDHIFVVNPALELEMNFLKFFRLGVGIHYRFVTGVNTSLLSNQDLSGPGALITFKFGWF
jgi:hypothetical protein